MGIAGAGGLGKAGGELVTVSGCHLNLDTSLMYTASRQAIPIKLATGDV